MSSESGRNYLDRLKELNPPPGQSPQTVKIAEKEWEKLTALLSNLEALSDLEWSAQKALAEERKRAAEETKRQVVEIRRAAEEAEKKTTTAISLLEERVGNRSEVYFSKLDFTIGACKTLLIIHAVLMIAAMLGVLIWGVLAGLGLVPNPF